MSDPPWYSLPADESGGVGHAGYPSAATPIVAAGTLAVVRYPTGTPTGPVPATLSWVVLLNASPFTLIIISGRIITQIAAFTADAIQVVLTGPDEGIDIMPVAGSGLIQTGTDSTVYATWYAERPSGVYPSAIGAGTTPVNQSALIVNESFVGPVVGPFSPATFVLQPWMQAIAIRLQNTGTANGFQCSVTDFSAGADTMGQAVMGAGQWYFVPVQGSNVSVLFTPLLNGAAGGNFSGRIRIFGLAGPLLNQKLAALINTAVGNVGVGQETTTNLAGGGTTATFIPRPASGTIARVRVASYTQAAAPAAGQAIVLRGITSLSAYFAWLVPAAISGDRTAEGFFVGNSGQIDPSEGLQVLNNTSQAAAIRISWDIIPTPFEGY